MRPDYSLYYIVDLPAPRDPIEIVRAAVAGGVMMVQLRGKHAAGAELYRLAIALKEILMPCGVPLIISDRLDVAQAAHADGVHVGADDLPTERVRELGPDLILGVSCYADSERARRAAAAGADYLAFGAFYPSHSKPEAQRAPLSVLEAGRRFRLPVVAIGGIGPENAGALVSAGADGVSVISTIQNAADPEAASRELRAAVECGRERAGMGGKDAN